MLIRGRGVRSLQPGEAESAITGKGFVVMVDIVFEYPRVQDVIRLAQTLASVMTALHVEKDAMPFRFTYQPCVTVDVTARVCVGASPLSRVWPQYIQFLPAPLWYTGSCCVRRVCTVLSKHQPILHHFNTRHCWFSRAQHRLWVLAVRAETFVESRSLRQSDKALAVSANCRPLSRRRALGIFHCSRPQATRSLRLFFLFSRFFYLSLSLSLSLSISVSLCLTLTLIAHMCVNPTQLPLLPLSAVSQPPFLSARAPSCLPLYHARRRAPTARARRRGTCLAERLACSPPTIAKTSSIPGRVTPGFLLVGIVLDDAVGRRVFSAISRLPRPVIQALLHTRLNHSHRLSRPRPSLLPQSRNEGLGRSHFRDVDRTRNIKGGFVGKHNLGQIVIVSVDSLQHITGKLVSPWFVFGCQLLQNLRLVGIHTELGGAVVTNWNRIREDPASNPGLATLISVSRGFRNHSRRLLGWVAHKGNGRFLPIPSPIPLPCETFAVSNDLAVNETLSPTTYLPCRHTDATAFEELWRENACLMMSTCSSETRSRYPPVPSKTLPVAKNLRCHSLRVLRSCAFKLCVHWLLPQCVASFTQTQWQGIGRVFPCRSVIGSGLAWARLTNCGPIANATEMHTVVPMYRRRKRRGKEGLLARDNTIFIKEFETKEPWPAQKDTLCGHGMFQSFPEVPRMRGPSPGGSPGSRASATRNLIGYRFLSSRPLHPRRDVVKRPRGDSCHEMPTSRKQCTTACMTQGAAVRQGLGNFAN
ncbi:hypothetical protein PR048_030408 [Dryococelus australis]|uniref:Uncharacterized protein n=1 Tax=Dryococelus australis TaxID=614101 RepID=A0ABQ9G8X4_9NEOP|nr:hypothetical protein PR048_030408 [Dryococelus australis]